MESNPKILLAVSSNRWGGGEKHVMDLALSLREQFSFTILVKSGGNLKERFIDAGFPVWDYDFSSPPRPVSLFNLLKRLRQERFHGIHCHLNQASFHLSLLRPAVNCPVLSTVHGYSSLLYYSFPNALISVSNAIHEFLPVPLRKKSQIIYNGISQCEFTSSTKSHAKPKGAILATLHRNKGQAFVLNALKKKPLPLELHIVGDGSSAYCQELKELASRIYEPCSVVFETKQVNLRWWWENCDFTLIPSYKEALSYVALESLSNRLPVLASKTGGLCEVIPEQKGGMFFQPGNEIDFLNTLESFLPKIPEYKGYLTQYPFLETHPQFKIETMLEETAKIYKKLFLQS
jgi:glycosyltransferase involved in cell wall biosynthesis